MNWTPFFDYSVSGLPAEIGYIIAGFIGIGIIVAIGLLIQKTMGETEREET